MPMTPTSLRRLPRWAAYALAVTAGIAMTAQSQINGQLGRALDNGLMAAALSFGGGIFVLAIIALISSGVRDGLRRIRTAISTGRTSWTFTLAGSAGAAFVLSQSAVSHIIGLALFTVSFVSGLTVGGLLIDRVGVGPAGRRAITPLRLVGALLGVTAVGIAVSGTLDWNQLGVLVFAPLACGIAVSWQQAANGRLTSEGKNAWATTLINFCVGFGLLMIGVAVVSLVAGLPRSFPGEPWLYLGGPVGIVFIAIGSVVVRYVGILVYGLCATTGQLVSALVVDLVWSPAHAVSASVVVGVLVVAVGATLASLSGRTRRVESRT